VPESTPLFATMFAELTHISSTEYATLYTVLRSGLGFPQ